MDQIVADKWKVAEQVSQMIPGYQYVYQGCVDTEVVKNLIHNGYALDTKEAEILQLALDMGMDRFDLYESSTDKNAEQVSKCFGKCRFIAGSLEEIRLIDEVAAARLKPGYLEVIGIRVVPPVYASGSQHGFPVGELAALAAEFRQLKHISIRGCLIQGDLHIRNSVDDNAVDYIHGIELGQYFRACYETAKQVSTAIPCGISYIHLGECAKAIMENAIKQADTLEEFHKAAQIMQHQNETAFYAKLLVQ